jgi:hypothetical protein
MDIPSLERSEVYLNTLFMEYGVRLASEARSLGLEASKLEHVVFEELQDEHPYEHFHSYMQVILTDAKSPGTAESFRKVAFLYLERLEAFLRDYPGFDTWPYSCGATFWIEKKSLQDSQPISFTI